MAFAQLAAISALARATAPGVRPWFTHGPSISRDRSLLKPLAECQLRGRYVPVTAGPVKSFTAAAPPAAGAPAGTRVLLDFAFEDLPDRQLERNEWAWIGRRTASGDDVFAVTLDEASVRAAAERRGWSDVLCTPLRDVADAVLCADQAAVLSSAQGYMHFHANNRHCARCGTRTEATKAGGARVCGNSECRHKVYPRVDPAAIVLVTSPLSVDGGAHVLLGRKAAWPQGRFSTLSGFSELGETIEEALCREVFEESGVVVKPSSLKFVCSQPWLFPQSLMIGFVAEAEPDPTAPGGLPVVTTDENELEACRWFAKDYVAARLGGGSISLRADTQGTAAAEFHIPGQVSVANLLITAWASADSAAQPVTVAR
jgi:NAD+ diphosphatase